MLETGFKRWLAEADTVVLVCWDLGHIWDGDIYDNIEKRPHGAHLLLGSCMRGCGVSRARYLTSSWRPDPSKNSYRYPRNYSPKTFVQPAKGQDFNPFFMTWEHRAAIRKEIARRAKEEATHDAARKAGRGATVHNITTKFSGLWDAPNLPISRGRSATTPFA